MWWLFNFVFVLLPWIYHFWRIEGSGLSIIRAASANENVRNNTWCKKPEEWLPCWAHKFKCNNRVRGWWILSITFIISNGAHPSLTGNVSCNQMRRITYNWLLESGSDHGRFHQSTQYHMVVRWKAGWTNYRSLELRTDPAVTLFRMKCFQFLNCSRN